MSGIGPAKAKELYGLGVTSIELLLKSQDKLNHHQKLGLKYNFKCCLFYSPIKIILFLK